MNNERYDFVALVDESVTLSPWFQPAGGVRNDERLPSQKCALARHDSTNQIGAWKIQGAEENIKIQSN